MNCGCKGLAAFEWAPQWLPPPALKFCPSHSLSHLKNWQLPRWTSAWLSLQNHLSHSWSHPWRQSFDTPSFGVPSPGNCSWPRQILFSVGYVLGPISKVHNLYGHRLKRGSSIRGSGLIASLLHLGLPQSLKGIMFSELISLSFPTFAYGLSCSNS